MHRAVDDLDLTIKEIRSTIYALQTPASAPRRPCGRGCSRWSTRRRSSSATRPRCAWAACSTPTCPRPWPTTRVAVLREGLSNAARHSGASRVEVEVRVEDSPGDAANELVVVVRDDGRGFAAQGRRSGLSNLAERAELLGGVFRVGPGADGGTELNWRVPLPD